METPYCVDHENQRKSSFLSIEEKQYDGAIADNLSQYIIQLPYNSHYSQEEVWFHKGTIEGLTGFRDLAIPTSYKVYNRRIVKISCTFSYFPNTYRL